MATAVDTNPIPAALQSITNVEDTGVTIPAKPQVFDASDAAAKENQGAEVSDTYLVTDGGATSLSEGLDIVVDVVSDAKRLEDTPEASNIVNVEGIEPKKTDVKEVAAIHVKDATTASNISYDTTLVSANEVTDTRKADMGSGTQADAVRASTSEETPTGPLSAVTAGSPSAQGSTPSVEPTTSGVIEAEPASGSVVDNDPVAPTTVEVEASVTEQKKTQMVTDEYSESSHVNEGKVTELADTTTVEDVAVEDTQAESTAEEVTSIDNEGAEKEAKGSKPTGAEDKAAEPEAKEGATTGIKANETEEPNVESEVPEVNIQIEEGETTPVEETTEAMNVNSRTVDDSLIAVEVVAPTPALADNRELEESDTEDTRVIEESEEEATSAPSTILEDTVTDGTDTPRAELEVGQPAGGEEVVETKNSGAVSSTIGEASLIKDEEVTPAVAEAHAKAVEETAVVDEPITNRFVETVAEEEPVTDSAPAVVGEHLSSVQEETSTKVEPVVEEAAADIPLVEEKLVTDEVVATELETESTDDGASAAIPETQPVQEEIASEVPVTALVQEKLTVDGVTTTESKAESTAKTAPLAVPGSQPVQDTPSDAAAAAPEEYHTEEAVSHAVNVDAVQISQTPAVEEPPRSNDKAEEAEIVHESAPSVTVIPDPTLELVVEAAVADETPVTEEVAVTQEGIDETTTPQEQTVDATDSKNGLTEAREESAVAEVVSGVEAEATANSGNQVQVVEEQPVASMEVPIIQEEESEVEVKVVAKEPVVEEHTGEESLAEEIPAQKEPVQEPTKEELAMEEVPAKGVPVIEDSMKEEHVEGVSMEEPITEESAKERPVGEPVKEELVPEEAPAKEESTVEEPVKEEPVVEGPIPVREEPVVEVPGKEEFVVEEVSASEKPIVEEPVEEGSIAEEPARVQPIALDVAVEEEPVEGSLKETPARDVTVLEVPVKEEPAAEDVYIEEPVIEESAKEESVVDGLVKEEPISKAPVKGESGFVGPTVEEAAPDESVVQKEVVEKSVVGVAAAEGSIPAIENTPVEDAVENNVVGHTTAKGSTTARSAEVTHILVAQEASVEQVTPAFLQSVDDVKLSAGELAGAKPKEPVAERAAADVAVSGQKGEMSAEASESIVEKAIDQSNTVTVPAVEVTSETLVQDTLNINKADPNALSAIPPVEAVHELVAIAIDEPQVYEQAADDPSDQEAIVPAGDTPAVLPGLIAGKSAAEDVKTTSKVNDNIPEDGPTEKPATTNEELPAVASIKSLSYQSVLMAEISVADTTTETIMVPELTEEKKGEDMVPVVENISVADGVETLAPEKFTLSIPDDSTQVERPKSPWTPSFQVTTIGHGVSLLTEEDIPTQALDNTEAIEVIEDAKPVRPEIMVDESPSDATIKVAQPQTEAGEPESTTLTWTPSYSVHSQGSPSPSHASLEQAATYTEEENSQAVPTSYDDASATRTSSSPGTGKIAEHPSIAETAEIKDGELVVEAQAVQVVEDSSHEEQEHEAAIAAPGVAERQEVEHDFLAQEPARDESVPYETPTELPIKLEATQKSSIAEVSSLTPPLEQDRPASPSWVPSYSIGQQGSPLPEQASLPDVTSAEIVTAEMLVGSLMESQRLQVDAVSVLPTVVLNGGQPGDIQGEEPITEDGPSTPWAPSYSITQQGGDVLEETQLGNLTKDEPTTERESRRSLSEEIESSSAFSPAALIGAGVFGNVTAYATLRKSTTSPKSAEESTTNTSVKSDTTPSESRQEKSFPTLEIPDENRLHASSLPPLDENNTLDTSSSLSPDASPTSRKRLGSTTSSRLFPGGWLYNTPKMSDERTSLEVAQGVFTSAKQAPVEETPASPTVDPITPDREQSSSDKRRWCIIM